MKRHARLLPAVGLILFLLSCSSAPEPETAPPEIHTTVDWAEFAWQLPGGTLARYTRLFGDMDPNPAGKYRRETRFSAAWDSLDADTFAALSPSSRRQRREQADELVRNAFLAVADRVYRLRAEAKVYRGSNSAMHLLDRVMLRALGRLHTAVGTDPSSAAAWSSLASFSAAVGDDAAAATSRQRLLAVTSPPDSRRPRAILDEAWSLRDAGRYEAAVLWLDGHGGELSPEPVGEHSLAPTVEAELIRALCAAARGDRHEARRLLSHLPLVVVPRSMGSRESEFLRTWVNAWAELRSGYPDLASNHLGFRRFVRLPAGVAWRYWQDLGLICEELGDRDLARRFWALAFMTRPFVGFYPQTALHGIDGILDHPDTDEPYFLSFRRFYTGGSLWGFTATRALACQIHDHEADPDLWRLTFASLDACVRRQIMAPEARLLRARLNLQRGDWQRAESDLRHAAVERLTGTDAEADLVFLRGVALLNAGRLEASLGPLRRCVELEPDHVRAWQSQAIALSYLGRDAEALAAYAEVTRIQPLDGTNYFNRGLLHLQQGRRDAAEADLLQAATLLDDNQRAIALLQAVASGREVTVDLAPQPVQLVASRDERALADDLDRLLTTDSLDPELQEMLTGSADERALWLELLEHRYGDEPTPEHRAQLAEARSRADDQTGVVALLAPAWPSQLSARERALLMDADRAEGQVDRAAAIAAGGVPAEALDVAVLVRATTILLDHGRTEAARQTFQRAQILAPDEPALRDLAARLP